MKPGSLTSFYIRGFQVSVDSSKANNDDDDDNNNNNNYFYLFNLNF